MRRQRYEFRARGLIRWTLLAAIASWVGLGTYGLYLQALPAEAILSVGFFVTFFIAFARYYWRMGYVVDTDGVTYRGAAQAIHIAWDDIKTLHDSANPLGGYRVETKYGPFVLSHLVYEHKKLADLIVARAGLFPT